uniref:Uncharacterized protein n=1 Tax=Rhizophora mucronata TaxID=61149 RepID=A0A2P2J5J7_RHIMU
MFMYVLVFEFLVLHCRIIGPKLYSSAILSRANDTIELVQFLFVSSPAGASVILIMDSTYGILAKTLQH